MDSNDDLTIARSDSVFPMNKVSKSSAHSLTMELEINHKKVTMEIDTGVTISVISVNAYKKFFSNFKLSMSMIRLRTYIGEPMAVVGKTDVQVTQRCALSLVGDEPGLFDRDRLGHVTLD